MNFLIKKIKAFIYKIILNKVDFQESVEIEKVISKGVGISWVLMDNVMLFKNKFPLPYSIKSIDVTYFNENGQNIGFLKYDEPIKLGPFSSERLSVESKMSNVTALFNVARFALFDHVKMNIRGFSTIQLLWMEFRIPVEDVIEMDKGKVQFATDEELEKRKKIKEKRKNIRKQLKEKRIKKREELKEKRRTVKEKIEQKKTAVNEEIKKEELPQKDEAALENKISLEEETKLSLLDEESSTLDQDKSYQDQ